MEGEVTREECMWKHCCQGTISKSISIVDMAALPSMLWNTTGAWGMEGPDALICILSVRQPTSLHFQIVGVESEKNLDAKGLKLLNIL